MAMEITNNYGSYASQYIAGNSTTNGIKKKIQNKPQKQQIAASQKVQQNI